MIGNFDSMIKIFKDFFKNYYSKIPPAIKKELFGSDYSQIASVLREKVNLIYSELLNPPANNIPEGAMIKLKQSFRIILNSVRSNTSRPLLKAKYLLTNYKNGIRDYFKNKFPFRTIQTSKLKSYGNNLLLFGSSLLIDIATAESGESWEKESGQPPLITGCGGNLSLLLNEFEPMIFYSSIQGKSPAEINGIIENQFGYNKQSPNDLNRCYALEMILWRSIHNYPLISFDSNFLESNLNSEEYLAVNYMIRLVQLSQ